MVNKIRLQTKIILLFSVVILITMSIAIVFNTYTFSEALRQTYVSQLKGITTTINGGYEESRSIDNVQQIFDYIKHREHNVLQLNLHVDEGGEELIKASTDRTLIDSQTPEILIPAVISGKTMISHLGENKEQRVRMIAPLIEDGKSIGAIELLLDTSKEAAIIQQRTKSVAIFGIGIALLLLIVLGIIIRRLLVVPLMKIREAAVSIQSGGAYKAVEVNASQEINEVAIALNELVFNLEDRYLKSITDPLTGTFNSAYFRQKLTDEMKQTREANSSMALLFCDVDNFKKLNDFEGHIYGDKVLNKIAQIVKEHVRQEDIVCRYGGEEFVVIMPGANRETALKVAEKLRQVVAIHGNENMLTPITVSIGVAIFPVDTDEENLTHVADQAMYMAKSLGKNQVFLASNLQSTKKRDYARNVNEQKWILDTIISLTKAVELKDSYTHSHSEMVSKYAGSVASSMGLSDETVHRISIAGLLHDVGKIGIPDDILNKEGHLTDEEYEMMKAHPVLGYNILASVDELKDTLPYVLHHHERPDGKGYPHGLEGHDIPLGARIIAVVDAYHSMTSARPYRKKPLTIELAKEQLIIGKGTQFDEKVVDQFISILDEVNYSK
ncbi:diguanylate cyclase [Bacillus suaedaesalsae]|uniref:Diguanylate cyclase n=1 Tax=Bacillus suaedaesalsae TaxID=2810349 RepID=A0ABS2DEI2_9BACI|nr:diguanylate cyclase [Bacillus suaedaesalsae]